MEQRGIVVKLEDQYAYVRVKRLSTCSANCAKCAGCDSSEALAKALNPMGAQVGNHVKIEIDSKKILIAAFLLYILPLILGLFIGVLVYFISLHIFIASASGVAIFLLSYFFIYLYNKKYSKYEKYIGNITEIFG